MKAFIKQHAQAEKPAFRRQRGDTLVEVLICILLVSVILTGAYVTTNRSSLGIRDSQEHGEALKLVQSQIEQVRQNATLPSPPVFTQPDGAAFCMVDAVVSTGAACIRSAGDTQAPSTEQPAYKLTVVRHSCAPDYTPVAPAKPCYKFTATATWTSITSKGNAVEQVVARLYQ